MNASNNFETLRREVRDPVDTMTQVLADVLIRFTLHGVRLPATGSIGAESIDDETEDILQLLLDHRSNDSEQTRRLAHAVANACRGPNHLYQDLGLEHRSLLSDLLRRHFAALHAKNTGNMKWKKFFYKQLCERAEINICRAPTCAECSEYASCFEPE